MNRSTLFDIRDDFPESLGDIREEEIAILLPMVKRILAVIDDGNQADDSGPLCEGQHG